MSIFDIFKKKKKEEPKKIIDAVALGLDPLFENAARIVVERQEFSMSYLQREESSGQVLDLFITRYYEE